MGTSLFVFLRQFPRHESPAARTGFGSLFFYERKAVSEKGNPPEFWGETVCPRVFPTKKVPPGVPLCEGDDERLLRDIVEVFPIQGPRFPAGTMGTQGNGFCETTFLPAGDVSISKLNWGPWDCLAKPTVGRAEAANKLAPGDDFGSIIEFGYLAWGTVPPKPALPTFRRNPKATEIQCLKEANVPIPAGKRRIPRKS